jgi:NIMA (never in mitosis gene a)-related kinase
MEKYVKLRKIGEGSFGNAFLVKANGSDKQMVMKEVDMTKVRFL